MAANFTCPKGHTHPAGDFHSYVNLKVEDANEAVVFTCPGGKREHNFTLGQAIKSGMLTEEQGEKIRVSSFRARMKAEESI